MIPTFKDAVSADIDNVFVNCDEFAETHVIDGRDVPCVIDTLLTQAAGDSNHIGVFVNQTRIHVRKDLIGIPPGEGDHMEVDGVVHLVRSVSDEMGMLVITTEMNRE